MVRVHLAPQWGGSSVGRARGKFRRFVSKPTHIQKKSSKMNSVIVEIRAAEGGDHAKTLVQDQLGIYRKVVSRYCL